MSTSDNGTCQCCPRCPCRVTSTGNRSMGLETEAGATDIKSFALVAELETTTRNNYTNSAAAEVVDAGNNNNNNNNDEERISLAESARETRRTHARGCCATAAKQVGNGNGVFFSNEA